MNHKELLAEGYKRVERDDRLLDVFTKDIPAKGVELWEKWDKEEVEIIRFWNNQKSNHSFSRQEIEQALQDNKRLSLK